MIFIIFIYLIKSKMHDFRDVAIRNDKFQFGLPSSCTKNMQLTQAWVLRSLIGNTQCENFRIFLPLRFYVKSILAILKLQKLPCWTFEQLWILQGCRSLLKSGGAWANLGVPRPPKNADFCILLHFYVTIFGKLGVHEHPRNPGCGTPVKWRFTPEV